MKTNSHVMFAIVLVALVSILTACGKDGQNGSNNAPINGPGNTPSGSVYGTWGGFPAIDTAGMKITFTLAIGASSVTNVAICSLPGGRSISASTTSAAEITTTQIKINEHSEQVASEDGFTCRATLDVGAVTYQVNGNTLKMDAGGSTLSLNRIN
jgi:hypothetical protein